MLTRLKVESFLSLRSVEVELGRLNVLIGRNASGKSNFVKLLRFLSYTAKYTIPESIRRLGYREVRDIAYGRNPDTKISITLEARLAGQRYTYTLAFAVKDYKVVFETLQADGTILIERTKPNRIAYLPAENERGMVTREVREDATAFYLLGDKSGSDKRIHLFGQFIGRWAFYNFNPSAIRGESPISRSEELAYDGSNLPQVLHTLLTTRRSIFMRIEEMLKAAVPEVEELLTPPTGTNMVRIAIRETGFEEAFEPEQLSDGTLRLLAFITALALPNPLVSFEEPENCIHPSLLQMLTQLARLSGKQVFITTHSPYLLNHAKPEEVYLVAKVKGETRIKRLTGTEDIDAVRRYLELGGTLGEAWVAGLLENEY